MSKQIQEAYIVAATRTPIGKIGAGLFQEHAAGRSCSLPQCAMRLKQVPTLDPKAIEDAIIGCSFPEGRAGRRTWRVWRCCSRVCRIPWAA